MQGLRGNRRHRWLGISWKYEVSWYFICNWMSEVLQMCSTVVETFDLITVLGSFEKNLGSGARFANNIN